MDVKTDIVIRAEHTGADSGSSGKTKHDGRKKQQEINDGCTAQKSMRLVNVSEWFKVTGRRDKTFRHDSRTCSFTAL